MRYSAAFIPTLREAPNDATTPSHVLLLRSGMVRMVGAGIYEFLPLGFRVLTKIANIVREEMNRAGAQEVMMPALLPREYFEESGRWSSFGDTLLRLTDRKKGDYHLGPTHEEIITDMVRRDVKSYRQLPLNLYQIQTKFRDEARPRAGLLRCREFIMKDAYSFDVSEENAVRSYEQMREAYVRVFTRLGLEFRTIGTVTDEFQPHAWRGCRRGHEQGQPLLRVQSTDRHHVGRLWRPRRRGEEVGVNEVGNAAGAARVEARQMIRAPGYQVGRGQEGCRRMAVSPGFPGRAAAGPAVAPTHGRSLFGEDISTAGENRHRPGTAEHYRWPAGMSLVRDQDGMAASLSPAGRRPRNGVGRCQPTRQAKPRAGHDANRRFQPLHFGGTIEREQRDRKAATTQFLVHPQLARYGACPSPRGHAAADRCQDGRGTPRRPWAEEPSLEFPDRVQDRLGGECDRSQAGRQCRRSAATHGPARGPQGIATGRAAGHERTQLQPGRGGHLFGIGQFVEPRRFAGCEVVGGVGIDTRSLAFCKKLVGSPAVHDLPELLCRMLPNRVHAKVQQLMGQIEDPQASRDGP